MRSIVAGFACYQMPRLSQPYMQHTACRRGSGLHVRAGFPSGSDSCGARLRLLPPRPQVTAMQCRNPCAAGSAVSFTRPGACCEIECVSVRCRAATQSSRTARGWASGHAPRACRSPRHSWLRQAWRRTGASGPACTTSCGCAPRHRQTGAAQDATAARHGDKAIDCAGRRFCLPMSG